MQANGKNYLITNWHVLSGRNPSNDQPLNANGITPDQIAIWHHERGKRRKEGQVLQYNKINAILLS